MFGLFCSRFFSLFKVFSISWCLKEFNLLICRFLSAPSFYANKDLTQIVWLCVFLLLLVWIVNVLVTMPTFINLQFWCSGNKLRLQWPPGVLVFQLRIFLFQFFYKSSVMSIGLYCTFLRKTRHVRFEFYWFTVNDKT
jgi:hypothetical protein